MDAESTGIQIPGYRILSLIGKGANATVYLALQESLNRHVALKILQKFDRPAQAVRFFNEGQIVASMNHPNIITIYDIGSVGSQQYIAMEYLDSGSLRDRVKEGVSPSTALDIIQSIGSALEIVHQMGIVHRDIKPENILFHKSGIPKITDFGVAKALDRDMNLTMDGTALGSPYYLSPEQAEGKDLDGRSDIYSLGVILFELLARRKPYLGESQIEVIFGHMNKPIPALPESRRHYQSLVEKMMAKDANERFASTREMLDYLKAFRDLGDPKPGKRKAAATSSSQTSGNKQHSGFFSAFRDRPWLSAGMGVALLLAVAALVVSTPSQQPVSADTAEQNPSSIGTEESAIPEANTIIAGSPQAADTVTEAPAPTPQSDVSQDAAIDDTNVAVVDSAPGDEIYLDTTTTDAAAEEAVGEGEETASADTENSPVGEEENVDLLLEKAETALQKYRLTSPKTDSAYYYYMKILKLEPGNKEASKGIRKLAGKYGFLADKALKKDDEQKARSYIERGLRIRPNDPALLERMAHLDELEAARLAPPPPPPEPVKPPPPPKPKPKPVNTSLQLLESLE
ncbi:protein kinase domain-containing protein [Thiolapillus sp.]